MKASPAGIHGAGSSSSNENHALPPGLIAPVVVRLDFPYPELSPNVHVHWTKKKDFIKAYRQLAETAARNVRIDLELIAPLRTPVDALALFVVRNHHRRDGDNLQSSIKSGIDGLVDARLLKDDSLGKLRLRSDYRICRPGEKPHVEIYLTQAPEVQAPLSRNVGQP